MFSQLLSFFSACTWPPLIEKNQCIAVFCDNSLMFASLHPSTSFFLYASTSFLHITCSHRVSNMDNDIKVINNKGHSKGPAPCPLELSCKGSGWNLSDQKEEPFKNVAHHRSSQMAFTEAGEPCILFVCLLLKNAAFRYAHRKCHIMEKVLAYMIILSLK